MSAALRSDDFLKTFGQLLLHVRISRYYDVNAAGSVFVMVLFAAVGLLAGGRRRWWLLIPLALVAAGLWASGSRTALALAAITAVAMLTLRVFRTSGRSRAIALAGWCAVMAVAAGLVWIYPEARNLEAGGALKSRVILGQTAVNMWRAAPALGIGIGRFQSESPQFGAEALRTELGFVTANENAHNYFLQIAAECGGVGLVALLALLAAGFVTIQRVDRNGPSPLRRWLAVGLLTYLATWLSGHPQLVPEAAMTFWFLFGILSAQTDPPSSRSRSAAIALGLALVVIVTAPLRAVRTVRNLDLEHVGVGLSVWQRPPASVPYREAGQSFAVYVPADGVAFTLPVRRGPVAPPLLRLTLIARGGLLRTVDITGHGWHSIPITLSPRGRRYELIRVTVTASEPTTPVTALVVHVGRLERQ